MDRPMQSVYPFCIASSIFCAGLFATALDAQELPKPSNLPEPATLPGKVVVGETPENARHGGPSVMTPNSTLPGHVLPRPTTAPPSGPEPADDDSLPHAVPTPPSLADEASQSNRNQHADDDKRASDDKRRPSLGLVAQERLDRNGLTVIEVRGGSPAQQAGLRAGDVLTRFNGRETSTIDDVSAVLKSLTYGDAAALEVLRGGKLYELHCKLTNEAPSQPTPPSGELDASAMLPSSPVASQPSSSFMSNAQHGVLGITVEDSQGLPTNGQILRGAQVVGVVSGSPAANAGIQTGDILVSVNGNVTYGARELTQYMMTSQPGQTVEVGYYHGGVLHRTNVTLGGADQTARIPGATLPGEGGPNVGQILDGVGRTLDGILGPDRPRLLRPSAPAVDPMIPNSASSFGSIPTPRTIPSPPMLATPVDKLSDAERRSNAAAAAGQSGAADDNAALRRQIEQLRSQMQALESKLQQTQSQSE